MLNQEIAAAPPRYDLSTERILAPIRLADFLDTYWGKRHLVVRRNDPGHYGPLFRLADVDRYLDVAAKNPAATLSYGQAGKPFRQARVQDTQARALYNALHQGSTILLDAVERFWPPVADLASELGETFGAKVKVNVYVTPPGVQGAPIHPDIQDVFVLQMEGAKEWFVYDYRIYELVETLDYTRELDFPRPKVDPDPPLAERALLESGDLLYLPRGCVHRAVAPPDRPSLHLTVCVTPVYWVDFLKAAVEVVSAEHPELARSLPPGFDRHPELRARLRAELDSMLRLVLDRSSFERTASVLARARARGRANPADGHFAQLLHLDDLGIDSEVHRRRGLVASLADNDGTATFSFAGGQVATPAALWPALEFIRDHDRFRVLDLPGSLSDESKLVLIRRLIREGFLRAAPGPANGG